jgi:ribonuclease D
MRSSRYVDQELALTSRRVNHQWPQAESFPIFLRMNAPKTTPHKSHIAELAPFIGLDLARVFVVTSERQAGLALEELMATRLVGFDTESKPTFQKGQQSEGPHVLQFATTEKAFIFQSHVVESHPVIMKLLKATELTKIGFGLGGDLQQISNRFGIRPGSIVDLDRSFKLLGYHNAVGVKSAIAMLFNRKLAKSKSVTTSNWSAEELSDGQLIYAANDAYAAIKVYHALQDGKSAVN